VGAESIGAYEAAARVPGRLPGRPAVIALILAGVVGLSFATLSFGAAVVAALACGALVVLAAIDLEHRVIPNRIVLPATAVVLPLHIAIAPGRASQWALAGVAAAFVMAIPALAGRDWIGVGDAKLALLIGAALGWGVIGAVLLAFVLTFPASLLVLARGGLAARKSTIPFGPFLVAGALIVMFAPHIFS
jgi:leader peptidase (prepilin peptidase)/N-methyltransferase